MEEILYHEGTKTHSAAESQPKKMQPRRHGDTEARSESADEPDKERLNRRIQEVAQQADCRTSHADAI